ncbi:hypothetical protein KM92CIT3_70105 [uncultured Citrobacter sp.]|uniref:Uncharacterized protein n=2 Tax=uncultured Citrobacter sp. TaxID=200446 RepID=A0A212IHZ6_9ENTR|nr:hypothetical protein KM92CIT3_70105 [uncultured Citrobacter sp.]
MQCGSVPGDSPVMNSANLYKGIGKIFLSGFNHEHAVNCPMYLNDVVILNKQTRVVYSFIPERVFQGNE